MSALAAGAGVRPGDPFPPLAEARLEGALPATEGRVLLVDFWASWCAPCKASFPALAKLHAEYASRGVVVLGVSVDDRAADYAAFLKKHAPPFATVRDHTHALAAAAQVPAMPTTFVIGRDGRVRTVQAGYHGKATDEALRAAVDAALADSSSS
ncbi:MAG TPA: TlpA disulfide reductase family protein [Opitutaceae bacterium]